MVNNLAVRALFDHTRSFDGAKFVQPGRRAAQRDAGHRASAASAPDGRIWPSEGRFFAPSGRRHTPLVVNQTKARSMPSQQTRESGQTIPYDRKVL